MIKKTDIALVLVSSLLLIPAFPDFDYYPLAWIALVPLLIALSNKSLKTSFYLGTLNGFVFFLGTIYWVSHSMHVYGNLSLAIAIPALMLLCLILSLYTAVFSIGYNLITRYSVLPALFTVPFLWVTAEYLRTYTILEYPWALLGYSQYRFLPLIQIADITGIYGISFLVAAVNGLFLDLFNLWKQRAEKGHIQSPGRTLASIICLVLVISAVIFYGNRKLIRSETGHKIDISVVQGNIEQDKKWNPLYQREVIDAYKRLTESVIGNKPEIVIWPEASLPFTFEQHAEFTAELLQFQSGLNTYLLLGTMTPKEKGLSNSAVLLSPDGKVSSVYDKIHLVPYGEYVPLRNFFPFIRKLTEGIGDFIPGDEPVVMELPFAKIGNLICYEIIFPDLSRNLVRKGANLLVTITNDAWFGRSSAPYQHFSTAVFRAIENRVPVVRAANTGISGYIDPFGRIIKKSDIFIEATMTDGISIGKWDSFYTRYGDIFVYLCLTITVILLARVYTVRSSN